MTHSIEAEALIIDTKLLQLFDYCLPTNRSNLLRLSFQCNIKETVQQLSNTGVKSISITKFNNKDHQFN